MRLFLVGFMGCGKTTVGRLLAERLGVPFVDIDSEVERAAGMAVGEIFATRGEGEFRRLEREALETTLKLGGAVIAAGGGTTTLGHNRTLIERGGVSVWLNVPFASIVNRVGALGKENRPLFKDEKEALALYRQRLPVYRAADLVVDVRPEESPEEVAARIELLVRRGRCGT